MKDIKNFKAEKYEDGAIYKQIEDGIYQYEDDNEVFYVTSLSFEQEPELEEGSSADDISQYPLEDILDEFFCHINDFYPNFNKEDSSICYLEFASPEIQDVRNLRTIIGKHVYNKEDGDYIRLIIE